MSERICGMCKQSLPLSAFYVRNDRKAPTSKCKACFGIYQKEYKSRSGIRERDRVARAEWQKNAARYHREQLAPSYVKKLLVQKTPLTFDRIPDSLVDLKRAQLNLDREIKERK